MLAYRLVTENFCAVHSGAIAASGHETSRSRNRRRLNSCIRLSDAADDVMAIRFPVSDFKLMQGCCPYKIYYFEISVDNEMPLFSINARTHSAESFRSRKHENSVFRYAFWRSFAYFLCPQGAGPNACAGEIMQFLVLWTDQNCGYPPAAMFSSIISQSSSSSYQTTPGLQHSF